MKITKQGFSLMEMMVVLLITAIVAAASAPMISKKMVSSGGNQSPWDWVGNTSIAFNYGNPNNGNTASIGNTTDESGWQSGMYIRKDGNNRPLLTLSDNGNNFLAFRFNGANRSILINNQANNDNVPQNATVLGIGASALSRSSIAIGNNTTAGNNGPNTNVGPSRSIAIGSSATEAGTNQNAANATGTCAIAIGTESVADQTNSTAVGDGAHAQGGEGATALGANAKASGAGAIALGLSAHAFRQRGNNILQARHAIAIGDGASASGNSAIAIGQPLIKIPSGRSSGANQGEDTDQHTSASGINAVAIGAGARASANNSVAIGANATAGSANQIVLGDANSTVYIRGNLVVDNNVVLARTVGRRESNQAGGVYIYGVGAEHFVRVAGAYEGRKQIEANQETHNATIGGFTINNAWSDRRLKNVGKAFTGGLEQIKKLEVFNYTFKKDTNKTPRVGVMAQDLQKIFPNAVVKGDDGFLRIRMEDMFYAVVNAIKELDLHINNNTKRIADLEDQNAELVKTVKELEKRLAKLEKSLQKN